MLNEVRKRNTQKESVKNTLEKFMSIQSIKREKR